MLTSKLIDSTMCANNDDGGIDDDDTDYGTDEDEEEKEKVWEFSPFSKTQEYSADKIECKEAVSKFCVGKVLCVLCVPLF